MKHKNYSNENNNKKKYSSTKSNNIKSRLEKINSKNKMRNPSLLSFLIKKNSLLFKVILISVAVLTLGIISFGFFFGKKNEVLPTQANFLDYDLANKNKNQIDNLLKNEIDPKLENLKLVINFGESQLKLAASDVDLHVDGKAFFEAAKKTDFSKNETIKPKLKFNEKKLENTLENFKQTSKILPAPFSYQRNGETLTVKVGRDGKAVDVEKTKKKIIDAFSAFDDFSNIDDKTIEIEAEFNIIENKNKKINFKELKKAIDCEPQDASFSKGKTIKEQVGILLPESEKQKIDNNPDATSYKLMVKVIPPKITLNILKKNVKTPDVLGSFTTHMAANKPANAIHNIKTAAAAINGTVIFPGDSFSFNALTKGKDYKDAIIYDTKAPKGEREEKGGGVCQASSTLFNACLHAAIKITNRSCHSYRVYYVPVGLDAAVSDGGKDLNFVNNKSYPIKIEASASNSAVTFTIRGTKVPSETFGCSVESHKTAETPTFVNAVATVTYTQNGAVVDKKQFSSHYLVREKDIQRALAAERRAAQAKAAEEAEKAAQAKAAEEAKAAQEKAAQSNAAAAPPAAATPNNSTVTNSDSFASSTAQNKPSSNAAAPPVATPSNSTSTVTSSGAHQNSFASSTAQNKPSSNASAPPTTNTPSSSTADSKTQPKPLAPTTSGSNQTADGIKKVAPIQPDSAALVPVT